jgi:diadenosine tetraphosphate (Ap4A) HIT family hydrolase
MFAAGVGCARTAVADDDGMSGNWPVDWRDLIRGVGCGMCGSQRPEVDEFGIRFYATETVDAYLQKANVQRGYTVVIWRGRHVTEPFELTEDESARYWRDVMRVAQALDRYYRPLKMNYETLGNSLPHLHTHLIPRYVEDPAPGRPFPLLSQTGSRSEVLPEQLWSDVRELRAMSVWNR